MRALQEQWNRCHPTMPSRGSALVQKLYRLRKTQLNPSQTRPGTSRTSNPPEGAEPISQGNPAPDAESGTHPPPELVSVVVRVAG